MPLKANIAPILQFKKISINLQQLLKVANALGAI